MNRYILLLIFFGSFHPVISQNLVPNNSLELHSSCPNNYSQLTLCSSWTLVASHTGTTDYFNTCGVAPVNTTSAFWGTQTPNTGNGYIGLLAWHSALPSGREYAQAQLTSPLVAGQTYTVSLMASLGDICSFATTLQIYFSNAPYVMSPAGSSASITTVSPQVVFTTVVTNKTGWSGMSFNYTAVGGEQYMIVGNFRNDAATVLTPAAGGSNNQTYYFIDDVSVILAPLPVELVSFSGECKGGISHLQWSTSSEINNNYFIVEESMDGILFTEASRVEGAGNSNMLKNYSVDINNHQNLPVYFRLIQVDFNGDTKTYAPIYVGCENAWNHECPQFIFSNQQLQANLDLKEAEELNFTLSDMKGSLITSVNYTGEVGQNSVTIPFEEISAGIYLVRMLGPNHSCVQKFFIN
jgi:hypothetical protein